MPDNFWKFNPDARRYYVTSEGAAALGLKPGSFIGEARLLAYRDALINKRQQRAVALANELGEGLLNSGAWLKAMRDETKSAYITQYLLAYGGKNNMTPREWGRLGGLLKSQYAYLNRMKDRIDSGLYSEAQIANYSKMYIAASGRAFEIAKTRQTGIESLPQYPGDGQTQCLTNCRCSWRIVNRGDAWECYWTLGDAEHCPDCEEAARRFNPLVIPKPIDLRIKPVTGKGSKHATSKRRYFYAPPYFSKLLPRFDLPIMPRS